MKLDMTSNFAALAKGFNGSGKQIRYASAVALSKTAKDDVRPALQDEMRASFDRPTPYTLNSVFITRATLDKPEAIVGIMDNTFGKGRPAIKWLGSEIYGGVRGQKGMERALQRAGILPAGWCTVPGAGADIDAYGNMSRGQIIKVLSWMQALRESGSRSNATDATKKKRMKGTKNVRGLEYFVSNGKGSIIKGNKRQHLAAGIWSKTSFAMGKAIKPVLLFVKDAHYATRFKFFEVATRVVEQKLPINLERELENALQTAIPKEQTEMFR